MARDRGMPAQVQEYLDQAIRRIESVLGVRPDLEPETLGLLEAYAQGAEDPSEEIVALAAVLCGVYFGELVRRRFGGWWVAGDSAPSAWRLELEPCCLYFSPVGMAAEVLKGDEVDGYDGAFGTAPEDEADLRTALAAQNMPEDEYYSFTGRLDVLEQAVSWLVETHRKHGRLRTWKPQDYAQG